MQKEIWKDVVGYEGLYQVSNLSRVKRLPAYINHKSGGFSYFKGGLIKPSLNKNPKFKKHKYYYLNLCKDGKVKTVRLHRILMIAFVDNVDDKPCINHINGIKTDNRLENLEWCTYSENNKHAYSLGLKKPSNTNEYNSITCRPVTQFSKTLYKIREYKSIIEAERKTGVNSSCIGEVCRNKNRRESAGGYIWKYSSNNQLKTN